MLAIDQLATAVQQLLDAQSAPAPAPRPRQVRTRGPQATGAMLMVERPPAAPVRPPPPPTGPSDQALAIAKALFDELIREGVRFDLHVEGIEAKPASEGATADQVLFATVPANFVLKIDSKPKLVEEAHALRAFADRADLPRGLRGMFARVYAIKNDTPPYAYLMERVQGASLSQRTFGADAWPLAALEEASTTLVDALFEGYDASRRTTVLPNVREIYLGRIADRLAAAGAADPQIAALLDRPTLTVNGRSIDYRQALVILEDRLDRLAVGFSTFVHGDLHPENVLLRHDDPKRPVMIDPKEWQNGDYLFDVGKYCHFLLYTGPFEKIAKPPVPELGEGSIDFQVPQENGARLQVDRMRTRVERFARDRGDATWEARYQLSMAANLLGLPVGRLALAERTGNRDLYRNSALMLLGAGLTHLADCAALLEGT